MAASKWLLSSCERRADIVLFLVSFVICDKNILFFKNKRTVLGMVYLNVHCSMSFKENMEYTWLSCILRKQSTALIFDMAVWEYTALKAALALQSEWINTFVHRSTFGLTRRKLVYEVAALICITSCIDLYLITFNLYNTMIPTNQFL